MNKCQSRVEPDSLNKHQWGKDPDAFYKSWSGQDPDALNKYQSGQDPDSLNKSWSGQDPKALNKCQWGQDPDKWGYDPYVFIYFISGSSPSRSDPTLWYIYATARARFYTCKKIRVQKIWQLLAINESL